jgi:asparagine synthase (glutamine-hydrolysing)
MSHALQRPVQTFSIGFAEESYNELPYARQVAQQFATDHHESLVTPEVGEILPRLAWQYDEPFADKSAVPTMYVARLASRHVSVVLTGDGGDEAFAGYDKYRFSHWQQAWGYLPTRLRRHLERRLLTPLRHGPGHGTARLLTRLAHALLPFAEAVFYPEFCDSAMRDSLYQPWMRATLAQHASPMAPLVSAGLDCLDDPVDLMQWLDYQWYLPGDLLVKMDIASMACGLEARSPFLDHQVIEFCAALPAALKTDGRTRKIALRLAFRGLLPDAILERPKQGFSLPLRAWLRGPLAVPARDLLVDHPRGIAEFFDLAAVRRMFEAHVSGRRNHAHRLWALMLFAQWYRPPPFPDHEPMPVYRHVSADHRRR